MVAFLGLGRMGLPMCRNLLAAGFDVRAWNRSPRTGVELAGSAAEAVAGQAVVVTMLPDLPDVQAVLAGLDLAGAVVVVMGTVSPVAVRQWAAQIAPARVVDAPVSGGPVGAEEGSLSIMAGGADADVAEVRPLLDAMGSTVRHLGPVGAGSLAKACNQVVVGITLAALGEALTLARRGGIDPAALLDVLSGGLAGSRALEVKRDLLASGRFEAGGRAVFQLKDLGFALEAARTSGAVLPVTALVDQLYAAMCRTGHGEDDHSGVVQVLELLSGL